VTYAYSTGFRTHKPEQVFDRGAEIARAHYAQWSEQPTVVQEIVSKLPHTLEIPVPTPKGKQPVYPRMLFLRREVLAPGQKPLETPVPPSKPEIGKSEALAALPNPWTIGATKPEPMADRPTVKRVVPLIRKNYVSKAGEVFDHCSIKWLKDSSKA